MSALVLLRNEVIKGSRRAAFRVGVGALALITGMGVYANHRASTRPGNAKAVRSTGSALAAFFLYAAFLERNIGGSLGLLSDRLAPVAASCPSRSSCASSTRSSGTPRRWPARPPGWRKPARRQHSCPPACSSAPPQRTGSRSAAPRSSCSAPATCDAGGTPAARTVSLGRPQRTECQ